MSHLNGNVPNVSNSKSISQSEIEKARKNMNSTASQNMILGAQLTSSSSSGSGSSVPSLSSSTSVGSSELENAKNKVQSSGSSKGMF